MPANASAKEALRTRIRKKIRGMTPSMIEAESRAIRSKLDFQAGERVAFFAALPTEPDLLPLLDQYPETHWYLPRVTGEGEMMFIRIDTQTKLKRGSFGILEPPGHESCLQFDTVLCPGVAFTSEGYRLGQGGGFYDRFLTKHRPARTLGVGFQCQIVDKLPSEDHDVIMDKVITS